MGQKYYIYLALGDKIIGEFYDESIEFVSNPDDSSIFYLAEDFDSSSTVKGHIKEIIKRQKEFNDLFGIQADIKMVRMIPKEATLDWTELATATSFEEVEKLFANNTK